MKVLLNLMKRAPYKIQWGWGITGQACPDWLKMTSSRTSKLNSGGLSRFCI